MNLTISPIQSQPQQIKTNFTRVQNKRQTSFGSVNLIQVSKKAFRNPDDASDVFEEFNKVVNRTTGEVGDFVGRIFNLVGKGHITNKTFTYFEESPAYYKVMETLQQNRRYSISWLSQNIGIPIAEPLSPAYHSFTILTKEQKDKASPLYSAKNLLAMTKKILNERTPDVISSGIWGLARMNQIFAEQLSPIIASKPVHKFVIDDLSQLPKVFEQIDY